MRIKKNILLKISSNPLLKNSVHKERKLFTSKAAVYVLRFEGLIKRFLIINKYKLVMNPF